jgi:peptidyl-prolyl cis-trans isomerase D
MLKQLGRLERTRNIIILGFAVLMAGSLVFFYAPTRSATNIDPAASAEVVAKVGSDKITVADIVMARESFRQRYGSQISLAQFGGNKWFLDSLIVGFVIRQEAERLGLNVGEAELADKIRKQFSDASGAFVGLERYKESVLRYGGIERFENSMRSELAQQKLRAFVTSSVNVSEQEVEEEYKRTGTIFELGYVIVSADKYAEKIQPTEADLRSYYDSHKDDLRYNVEQRKIRYLYVDQEKAASKLQISDQDLKAEYDGLQPQFKQAGVKAQQIMLKVARTDLDAQVDEKVKQLIAQLRGTTGKATEQAFADAAKGNSEDPATAKNGGWISGVIKKNPNKPHGLYERLHDMEPGDVTDVPIKYGSNYYILRRGDPVPKTFEEAKQELLVSLRNRRSYAEALKIATRAQARLKETKDPQKVAQELAAQANMSVADMVRETPYIKPGDDVKDIGTNQQFEQAIGSLNNSGDVGDSTGIKGGFAIPMLVDKKEPRIPEFDEARSKISDLVKEQRAKDQLERKAKEFAASVTSAAALVASGEKEGFESKEDLSYKLGTALGAAGTSDQLEDQIYAMKSGEVSKTPIKVGDDWVVVGIMKRNDVNMSDLSKERERVRSTLLRTRQDQVFGDYIASVQQRMKRDGRIYVYEDVLGAIKLDEEPAAMPNFPGGFNFPSK